MRSHTPSAPDFHPEFGYLWPSGRLRVGVRLAAACVTLCVAFGASTALFALTDRAADVNEQVLSNQALSEQALSEQGLSGQMSSAATTGNAAGSADAESARSDIQVGSDRAAQRARRACNNFVGSFLNQGCRANEPRRRRAERSNHRVATVIIGRVDPRVPAQFAVPLPVARPAMPPKTPKLARDVNPTSQDLKPKNSNPKDLNRNDLGGTAFAQASDRARGDQSRGGFPFMFGGGLFGLR